VVVLDRPRFPLVAVLVEFVLAELERLVDLEVESFEVDATEAREVRFDAVEMRALFVAT